MKKSLIMVALLSGVAWGNNVTDTLSAGQTPNPGDILYYQGISGNTAGTWAQPSSIPGLQGPQGATGAQGPKGDTGAAGKDGKNGTNGKDGANGLNAGMNNNLFLNVGADVRWYDAKHFAFSSGYRYDVNHYNNTVDMFVLHIKLGKSYEEKVLENQQKQINALRRSLSALEQ